jgi:hypothetical protein
MAALRNLVKSRGWELLVNMAQDQIATRSGYMNDLQIKDIEGIAEHNYSRGERDGIRLFASMPELLIENYEEDLKDVETEE